MTGAQPKMKSQHIKSRIGFQVEERKKAVSQAYPVPDLGPPRADFLFHYFAGVLVEWWHSSQKKRELIGQICRDPCR